MRPAFALATVFATALAFAIVACKGDDQQKAPPEPKPQSAKPSDAAIADASGRTTKVEIAPEKRKAYRKHLREGRKLAKSKNWADAVTQFESALAAIPGDGRALSELGWAAFQAGDFGVAQKANSDSVRASTEPKLRAASLYNLGRIAEASGDKKVAAQRYGESLKLRHNETVVRRLAGLVGSVGKPWKIDLQYLPCTEPRPLDQMCACLKKQRAEDYGATDEFECENKIDADSDAPWGIIKTTYGYGDVFVDLVGRGAEGWSLAAVLEQVYNPGVAGVWEELQNVSVEVRDRGDKKVIWAEVEKSRADTDPGINEEESSDTVRLTICVIGGDRGVSCLFNAPISEDYTRALLFEDKEHEAEVGDMHTPGLPISHKGKLSAELAADGTLVVELAEGEKTNLLAPYVGTHTLW